MRSFLAIWIRECNVKWPKKNTQRNKYATRGIADKIWWSNRAFELKLRPNHTQITKRSWEYLYAMLMQGPSQFPNISYYIMARFNICFTFCDWNSIHPILKHTWMRNALYLLLYSCHIRRLLALHLAYFMLIFTQCYSWWMWKNFDSSFGNTQYLMRIKYYNTLE